MSRYFFAATIWCLCSLSAESGQESRSGAPASATDSTTQDAIRALRDGLVAAIREKDADAVMSYLHEDVVLTAQSGTELRVFRKHEGVRDYLETMLTGENPAVASLTPNVHMDERTVLHGNDTGIAFGSSNDHYVLNQGRQAFNLATRWSATIVREGDGWSVANLHVSSNIFDNPVIAAAKRRLYAVGSFAALSGLVVGFLCGLFFMARRISI